MLCITGISLPKRIKKVYSENYVFKRGFLGGEGITVVISFWNVTLQLHTVPGGFLDPKILSPTRTLSTRMWIFFKDAKLDVFLSKKNNSISQSFRPHTTACAVCQRISSACLKNNNGGAQAGSI